MPKTKYLVCVNHNDHSRTAMRFACMKAASDKHSTVALLTVNPPIDFQTFGTVAEAMRAEQQDEAKKLMKALKKEAIASTGITPECFIKEGHIAQEIIAMLKDDEAINMLVLGTSKKSPSKDSLLPALTSELGEKIFVPILLIPGNLTEKQMKGLV
jgi:nucleotide-binding universal stress UspA family protein